MIHPLLSDYLKVRELTARDFRLIVNMAIENNNAENFRDFDAYFNMLRMQYDQQSVTDMMATLYAVAGYELPGVRDELNNNQADDKAEVEVIVID